MIELSNIQYFYSSQSFSLGPLSLTVPAERRVAILGLNGSGKTTLLKLMAGLLVPQSGQVSWGSVSVSTLSSRELAQKRAVVFQSIDVPFGYTLREFVLMGRYALRSSSLRVSEEDLCVVEASLKRFSLIDLQDRDLRHLSGGELQRAQLAQAFSQGAGWIFLDEPLNHLDIKQRSVVLRELERLHHDKKSLVAVVHDLSLARDFFDVFVLLHQGRLVVTGDRESLSESILREAFETKDLPSF